MKSVLITGVRGGIGSAVASYFNKKGYRVFGLDYQDVPCDWVDAGMYSNGCLGDNANIFPTATNLFYVKTDLTKEESVKKAYAVVSECMKLLNKSEEKQDDDAIVCVGLEALNGNDEGKSDATTILDSIKTTNGNVDSNSGEKTISDSIKTTNGNVDGNGGEEIIPGSIKNKNSNGFEECEGSENIYLDGIIHAAGKYDLNSLVEMPEKDFVGIFEINVFAIYRVNKAFISLLKEESRIVITASELAPLDPLPFTGIYGITKTTIEKYCHSLRMELQLLGIKVIELRPGAVRTGLLDHSMNRIDSFVQETELYKHTSSNFRKIATSVESKSITPETLAEFIFKVFNKHNPKFIYNINRNPLLLLLNALPDRFQTWVIKQILIH